MGRRREHLSHGRRVGAPDGRRRRDLVWTDPRGLLAHPRDPLRDEQPRMGSRRRHLLGRRWPLLLGGRRTDVESRPRRRGRAGRLRPLGPQPRLPEHSGVVRRLQQLVRRQGVHPEALGAATSTSTSATSTSATTATTTSATAAYPHTATPTAPTT